MNSPTVSVIVPCYNVDRWLAQAIESLLVQTFDNYEVILINDGSTDDTPLVLSDISRADPRFRVENVSNGGVGRARNLGLDLARGEFIAFLDPDDVLDENFLTHLLDALIVSNADIAVCDYSMFADCGRRLSYLDGRARRAKKLPRWQPNVVWSDYDDVQTRHCFSNLVTTDLFAVTWNKLYRKRYLSSVEARFPPLPMGEDYLFNLKVFAGRPSFVLVPRKLYRYRVRNDAATQRPLSSVLPSIMVGIRATREFAETVPVDRDIVGQKALNPLIGGLRRSIQSHSGRQDLLRILSDQNYRVELGRLEPKVCRSGLRYLTGFLAAKTIDKFDLGISNEEDAQ